MAKAKVMAQDVATTETGETVEPFFIMWGAEKIFWDDLPQVAKEYLAKHGAKQSFGEAVAGMRKKLEGEGKSEDFILAEMAKAQAEKWEKIYSGKISVREGTTRLSSEEKTKNEIAKGMIAASLAKAGKKMPSAENLESLIEAVRVKHADKIEAEYQRQRAALTIDEDILA